MITRYKMRLPEIKTRHVLILLLSGFGISLLPVLVISFFAHQTGDDYLFSLLTHQALENGGGLVDVFAASAEKTAQIFNDWQGTYSAVFLMTLQPGIWGEQFYFLTTFIMLSALIFSNILFFRSVFKYFFQADRDEYLIISIVVLLICIQMLPSPVQGFFWYNGALYYNFYHSLLLTMAGILIIAVQKDCPVGKKRVFTALAAILAFVIGGGNFVTALSAALLYSLFVLILIIKKDFRGHNLLFLIPFVILLAGFAVSVLAPGNAVRQGLIPDTPSAVESIFISFREAIRFSSKWLSLPVIICFLFLSPLFIKIAFKTQNRFRFPLLFSGVSFCLLSAMFTPPRYAMNNNGDDRLINIIFFTFVILAAINCFYWLGWIVKRLFGAKEEDAAVISGVLKKHAVPGLLALALVFAAVSYALPSLPPYTTTSAVYSLVSGEAQEFKSQQDKRLEIYKNPQISDVYVKRFTVKPYLLFYPWMEEMRGTPDGPPNHVARYYGKNFVLFDEEN